jgi:L-lactate dehydrogenase complex protein LldG
MSARERILSRIRAAQSPSARGDDAVAAVQDYVRSHPAGPLPRQHEDALARFRERALSLGTTIDDAATFAAVPAAVAAYLRGKALPLEAVIWPELSHLDWSGAGLTVAARPANGDDKAGITGCFCAIAETGTLMTLTGSDTPSNVSLLPETHIAVVPCERIVRGMEDGWALLRAERGDMPRAVHFISGPSRTGDIEQTITLGAHGPYRVHVVLVKGEK